MKKEINTGHGWPLHTKAVHVEDPTDEATMEIIRDLKDTLHAKQLSATGLASNQVWDRNLGDRRYTREDTEPPRIFVAYIPGQTTIEVFINPVGKGSGRSLPGTENCLSFPNSPPRKKKRHKNYTIFYINEDGEESSFKCTLSTARMLQHEMDHLNGKVIEPRG